MPKYDEIIKSVRKAGPEPQVGQFPKLDNPADSEDNVPGIDIPQPIKAKISRPKPEERTVSQ